MIKNSANRFGKNLCLACLAVLLSILFWGAVQAIACAASSQVNISPTARNVLADEQHAVALLNADRRFHDLPNLTVNFKLTVLGEQYAQDMIKRNFFDHMNPEGQSPFARMKKIGIFYSYAGENIAINQSVLAAEIAFMNSSGHRANILNPYFTHVGIGVAYDDSGNIYVVQEFIRPKF